MQENGWVGRTEIPAMQQKVTQMEGFYFHAGEFHLHEDGRTNQDLMLIKMYTLCRL